MGVYKSKDHRGKGKVYVRRRWPNGSEFKRVAPNKTVGKKLFARIEESIAMGTWRTLKTELEKKHHDPLTIAERLPTSSAVTSRIDGQTSKRGL